MSRIDFGHWKISTGRHFQNDRRKNSTLSDAIKIWYVGRWWCPKFIPDIEKFLPVAILKMAVTNTAQIPHCPISTPFHMWVDYDVPNWFLTPKHFYRTPFSKWPPQYRTNSKLSDFNDISYVGRLWCPESIPDIEKFLPVAFQNGHHNTAQIQHCSISMSWIDSRHRNISTGLHFQNGRHNTAKIQHCSISKVDFDLFFKPVVSG